MKINLGGKVSRLKKAVYKNQPLNKIVAPVYHATKKSKNFTSGNYWEKRYKKGGNSGAGSYGRLAKFKAEYLNDFVSKNNIKSVIEFGSGDGSQLKLFNFKSYIGLDVSKTSIDLCRDKYSKDKTKSFYLYSPHHFIDNHNLYKSDLGLSLDVIYHLVEDVVFDKYMKDLFSSSTKFVIIYSSNTNDNKNNYAQHVRHRKFTDWVSKNEKNWKLIDTIENKYQAKTNEIDESFADFYVYKNGVNF